MPRPLPIQTFTTPENCARFVGTEISSYLAERKSRPTLLFLSGGSALTVLDHIQIHDGKAVTVTMLDERFERDEAHNNFRALEQTPWYEHARQSGAAFISTRIQTDDTKETAAERFTQALTEWRKNHPDSEMVALFGMGADGHTAGIFPFPENPHRFQELFLSDRLIVAYDASGKNDYPDRITTTLTLHQKLARAFVFITGEEKQAAFQKVLSDNAPLHELPAQIFHDLPNVTIGTTLHP